MLTPKFVRKRRVVEAVNQIRSEDSRLSATPIKRLPKGQPGNRFSCPLATALNIGKLSSVVAITARDYQINYLFGSGLPTVLAEFVADVDAGEYPELTG